jgi:dGTPase
MPSLISFSQELIQHKLQIKHYLRKALYEHEKVSAMTDKARNIINRLFNHFMNDPAQIPVGFKNGSDDDFSLTIADYIAGMTDRFAIQIHNNID